MIDIKFLKLHEISNLRFSTFILIEDACSMHCILMGIKLQYLPLKI